MIFEQLKAYLDTPYGTFHFVCTLIAGICALTTLTAVAVDFSSFHKREGTKKEKKSIVDTSSMLLFFFVFYLLIKFRITHIDISFIPVRISFAVIGVLLLITGCTVNILGRLELGRNWSNQLRIYKDQTLVTNGMFGVVRHPLYASIIWMFFGASFVFLNAAAFLSTLFVFVPFMKYRASQEEKFLAEEFKEYNDYASRIGMFIPKLMRNK